MAKENEGKSAGQGGSLAGKKAEGTSLPDERHADKVATPGGGTASAQQGSGGPRQSAIRSGMTGGQLGDAAKNAGGTGDPAKTSASQFNDTSGVAGGYQDPAANNGEEGTDQTSAEAGEGRQKS